MHRLTLTALAPAACSLIALSAATAQAQTQSQSWEYKAYYKDKLSNQYNKEKFNVATVSLEEKDGKATFRMITPGRGDPCFSRGDLPAEVERGADVTTITVKPELTGCEPFRYVIKNDGSGGTRFNLRNDKWAPDGLDHGLTAKR